KNISTGGGMKRGESSDLPWAQVIEEISREFAKLLDTSEREEELQRYLAAKPLLIYPDYIECYPKLKLGSDYVTDFAFVAQGTTGREHILVEIESASKPLFTKTTMSFSAEFTQAKDQLLNWETWVSENLQYLRRSLPGVSRPKYHLIMGRDSALTD